MYVGITFLLLAQGCAFASIPYNIVIQSKPIHQVDRRFLSVTLDSSGLVSHFKHIDFNSVRFQTLSRGLNSKQQVPEVYLRVGGSNADDLVYDASDLNVYYNETKSGKTYNFNFSMFDKLYRFAANMNWRLIFDLNSLIRKKDGSWDPSNAVELIKTVDSHNYSIDYELGNEPDLYPTHRNLTIEPKQLASDFKTLKEILLNITNGDSKLYGPDMATLGRYGYFHKFLSHVEEGVLDAITFHHYYSASTNITAKNFTSIPYLDTFIHYGERALNITKQSITTFKIPPIRIGETSSTYGGGSPEVGESFAASFLWLDKLGLAAQFNFNSVTRQTLKGGFYSLIDRDYNPCVDYWVSVLYKQLVGTKVLNVTGFLEHNRSVRAYAHCVNDENERGYESTGTIALFVLNMNETEQAEIQLEGSLADLDGDSFVFTSETGKMDSRFVKLNGEVLKMINDEDLPELLPLLTKQPFVLPPLSYGFFVVDVGVNVDCS